MRVVAGVAQMFGDAETVLDGAQQRVVIERRQFGQPARAVVRGRNSKIDNKVILISKNNNSS